MEKLQDAVYGAAVGDALGVPYEFGWRGKFQCTGMKGNGAHNQPAGTWSDDTSLLIATCDSIRAQRGAINTDDMRKKFCLWMNSGRYTPDGCCFDIGTTTSTALVEGKGCISERSNGNGSLMRIVPLAFTRATNDDIAKVSAITHAHSFSVEACIVFVAIARDLIRGVPLAEALIDHAPIHHPFERLATLASLQEDDIESSGYVVHTLEASLWCLLKSDSYASCVLQAVNLGRDSDTTACVAGALAGIMYGFDAIPSEWIEILRGKQVIDACLFHTLKDI